MPALVLATLHRQEGHAYLMAHPLRAAAPAIVLAFRRALSVKGPSTIAVV